MGFYPGMNHWQYIAEVRRRDEARYTTNHQTREADLYSQRHDVLPREIERALSDEGQPDPGFSAMWDPNNYWSLDHCLKTGHYGRADFVCPAGHKWRAKFTKMWEKYIDQEECCPTCHWAAAPKLFDVYPVLKDWWSSQNKILAEDVLAEQINNCLLWDCPEGHTTCRTIRVMLTLVAGDAQKACTKCQPPRAPARRLNIVWPKFDKGTTIAQAFPELVSWWSPQNYSLFAANSPAKNATSRYYWRCAQGHEFSRALYLMVKATEQDPSRVCKECAKLLPRTKSRGGFDRGKSGSLYLIGHSDRGLLKIGISNQLDKRLAEHRRYGWELLDVEYFANGAELFATEKQIKSWKRHCAKTPTPQEYGGGAGYTESWTVESMPVNSIAEIMKKLTTSEGRKTR
jgi:predicted GIY-YIG superfamily endonuclease